MQTPVHPPFGPGKNRCGRVEIWVDGWWTVKKMKEQNKMSPQTIDVVSYAAKMSVNCATCVFVVSTSMCPPKHV